MGLGRGWLLRLSLPCVVCHCCGLTFGDEKLWRAAVPAVMIVGQPAAAGVIGLALVLPRRVQSACCATMYATRSLSINQIVANPLVQLHRPSASPSPPNSARKYPPTLLDSLQCSLPKSPTLNVASRRPRLSAPWPVLVVLGLFDAWARTDPPRIHAKTSRQSTRRRSGAAKPRPKMKSSRQQGWPTALTRPWAFRATSLERKRLVG